MVAQMVREAVGVFTDTASLEAAVDDLQIAGFDRAHLSLAATRRTIEQRLGHLYERMTEAEDDPDVPRIAFVDIDSRTEGKGAAIAGLGYLGAMAAAGAVIASGGTAAIAALSAAAAGGVGVGAGTALGRYVDRFHTRNLEAQLARGGVLLWALTPTPESEARACEILRGHGAADVHVHALPQPEGTRSDGASAELTWIGKPILENVLRREPSRPSPPRG
jgi:hypothetical protein